MTTLLAVRDDIVEGRTYYFKDDDDGMRQAKRKLMQLRGGAQEWLTRHSRSRMAVDVKADCTLTRVRAGSTDEEAETVRSEDEASESESEEDPSSFEPIEEWVDGVPYLWQRC